MAKIGWLSCTNPTTGTSTTTTAKHAERRHGTGRTVQVQLLIHSILLLMMLVGWLQLHRLLISVNITTLLIIVSNRMQSKTLTQCKAHSTSIATQTWQLGQIPMILIDSISIIANHLIVGMIPIILLILGIGGMILAYSYPLRIPVGIAQ